VRGGTFENLGTLRLRAIFLVFVALGIQLLLFPTPWWPTPPIVSGVRAWHLASYFLLATFLAANWRLTPLWGVALGAALNTLVIAVNGGLMPTSLRALERSGNADVAEYLASTPDASTANVIAMGPQTTLDVLGDWLYLPAWVPFGDAFSIGDAVLMVGVAWLIQHAMVTKNLGRK
jgi:Kef-type K+ transport system membrane component KefB